MAKALFKLNYDSGIIRDGTKYQGQYCTNAQWCRFQRKKLRKIGGMKGIPATANSGYTTDLISFPVGNDTLLVASTTKGFFSYIIDPALNLISAVPLLNNTENISIRAQSALVKDIGRDTDFVVFIQSFDFDNINTTTAARFYSKPQNQLTNLSIPFTLNPLNGVNPLANSGLCFISPFLFIYGANGVMQHSKTSDPFDFNTAATVTVDSNGIEVITPSTAGTISKLGTDRIIYMSPIRGGTNDPSFLVWTLTSVIRVTNVGTESVEFNTDVISRNTGILSSRCVVENNGIFYWMGTKSFYVYNGVVRKLKNALNHNYFFDNLDIAQRQKVFGINFDEYNEIWWFYPTQGGAGNTKVLIFNYDPEELSWYDSEISREAGVFSIALNQIITVGYPLVNPDGFKYIWAHEVGYLQNWTPVGTTVALNDLIPSSFTTPLFSFAAFPPTRDSTRPTPLLDRWAILYRIEPDFISNYPIPSNFTLILNSQNFPQSPVISDAAINFTGGILGATPKLDLKFVGRNISFTFTSSQDFELGNIHVLVGVGSAI